ncbi:MAG: hypothetical protein WBF89_22365, partial [Steroidobacteraceae bacterium]
MSASSKTLIPLAAIFSALCSHAASEDVILRKPAMAAQALGILGSASSARLNIASASSKRPSIVAKNPIPYSPCAS